MIIMCHKFLICLILSEMALKTNWLNLSSGDAICFSTGTIGKMLICQEDDGTAMSISLKRSTIDTLLF